jgi:tRNA G10  N-methylase Trm11
VKTARKKHKYPKKKRKSPSGKPTNKLILTAHVCDNSELFPKILSLYVPKDSKVADVTYGKGVFWKNVDKNKYEFHPSDIKDGIDCLKLTYIDDSFDCIVFDPPYMHISGQTTHNSHQKFEEYYQNNNTSSSSPLKYHDAVLDLYYKMGAKAFRILKNKGIFIVKCMDEVCANVQRLTHLEITNDYIKKGFIIEDLFVLVRSNKPGVSNMIKQVHGRKNHSYFLVFRKFVKRKHTIKSK